MMNNSSTENCSGSNDLRDTLKWVTLHIESVKCVNLLLYMIHSTHLCGSHNSFHWITESVYNTVFKMGTKYQRIDVVFDRYQDEWRCHKIENDSSVPLLSNWASFMALEENKADLAQLLSNHLIEHSPTSGPVVVIAGGSLKRLLSSHLTQISKSRLWGLNTKKLIPGWFCTASMLIWKR